MKKTFEYLGDDDRQLLDRAVEALPEHDVWSLWNLTTLPDGQVNAEYSTNDDDDDGVAGDVVFANYTLKDRASALQLAGVTRRGVYGHQVTVQIDGQQI